MSSRIKYPPDRRAARLITELTLISYCSKPGTSKNPVIAADTRFAAGSSVTVNIAACTAALISKWFSVRMHMAIAAEQKMRVGYHSNTVTMMVVS